MAEPETEAEVAFELEAAAYPDLDPVPVEERRRVWALTFLMEVGKGAASAATVVKEARVIEEYLAGRGAALKLAKPDA